MKDIEDKLAAFLMEYGVLKNADADKMAKKIAGMFEKERGDLLARIERDRATESELLDDRERICDERDQLAAEVERLRECCAKGFEDAQKWSGQPLRCDVDGGRLIVSIGIATLGWAAKKRNGGPIPNNYGIEDKEEWARDVSRALCHEDEIGNTILQDVLDMAMENAMNRGSCGLRYPRKKNRHEQTNLRTVKSRERTTRRDC